MYVVILRNVFIIFMKSQVKNNSYSFDQILMNPKTDPGLFTFKTADFPGVEVIDMR